MGSKRHFGISSEEIPAAYSLVLSDAATFPSPAVSLPTLTLTAEYKMGGVTSIFSAL